MLSGTEVWNKVSIVNIQQTLFSQFRIKELYCRNLVNLIGFSAPFQHKAPHPRRDFPEKPLASIVTDVVLGEHLDCRSEPCHKASVPSTRTTVQRLQKYDTFTQSYHPSDRQEEVRRVQTWNLNAKLEFTISSKNPFFP